MEPRLLVIAGLDLVLAAILLRVVTVLSARPVSDESRGAWSSFVLWWAGLAVLWMLSGALAFAGALEVATLDMVVAHALVERMVAAAAVGSLAHYLVFLLTGRAVAWLPAVVVYSVLGTLLVYAVTAGDPIGVVTHEWMRPTLAYATPATPTDSLVNVAMVATPILGGVFYLRIRHRMLRLEERDRATMVGISVLAWWSLAVAAYFQPDIGALQLAARLVGVGALVVIRSAYDPPRRLRRRWEEARMRTA